MHNFTLVNAGELNVNGARILAHKRREFWFIYPWNNPGLHEIRWKEDFRTNRLTFENIVHLVQPFIAKTGTQFRKKIPLEKNQFQCIGWLLPCRG